MAANRIIRLIEGPVDAVVRVPGSKSVANRALVCAALANGASIITNAPDGDDTLAMLGCLTTLGLAATMSDGSVSISGVGPNWGSDPLHLHAGLAGTTSRFITALAALGRCPVTIDGHPPLRKRPFGPLHTALGQLGVLVTPGETVGGLPVTIQGPPSTGEAAISGDVSSQYVTALMLIGPYLPGGLRLRLTTELISRPYVDLTASVMAWFGRDDVSIGPGLITVGPGAYTPADVFVEPDATSAGYPLAIAAVVGGAVEIAGLGNNALQGDARFPDQLAAMGCSVERTDELVRVRRDGPLHGIDIDMADVSDLVPTMAVVAAVADTPSRIRGVGFIRDKESDRLGDLAGELRKAGVDIDEHADGLDIRPSLGRLRPARLATHHDHRLAMAFAVLGSVTEGVQVEDPDVVSKSWPGFWTMLDESFS